MADFKMHVPRVKSEPTPRHVLVRRLAALRAYRAEHPEEIEHFAAAERRLMIALGEPVDEQAHLF